MKQLILEKVGPFARIIFISAMLVGIGPPPDGTTVDAKIGGGLNQFQTGGCATPRYLHKTRHVHGEAGIVGRFRNGLAVGIRGAGSGEEVLESTPVDPEELDAGRNLESEIYSRYSAKLTFGWHSDYFGGDLGITGGRFLSRRSDGLEFVPSINFWGGEPAKVYAFLSLFDRPILLTSPPLITAGFGGSPEQFHWKLGAELIRDSSNFDERFGLFASATVPIIDSVRLGGEVSLSDGEGFPPLDACLLFSTTW